MNTVSGRPLVDMRKVTRRFPGVTALDQVDFQLEAGEVHVLFGENGAGKSTLISILSGAYPASDGQVFLDGEEVRFASVSEAKKHGVSAVFQEFSLVPTLSVAENIFLGNEPGFGPFINPSKMRAATRALFAELGFAIDPRRKVGTLSRAEQQMCEIAKAIHAKARVLILDEPTASLTERETETLFRLIDDAKARGTGIIYISHRIQEFQRVANRVTVLRDGKLIGTVQMSETSPKALIDMMTGRSISEIYPKIAHNPATEHVLKIENLHAWGVSGATINVRAGEVLAVAGLVGSGKSRFWRAALGLNRIESGRVTLRGEDVTGKPTRRFVTDGVFYLSPDRKHEGLILDAPSRDNLRMGLLDRATNAMGFVSGSVVKHAQDAIKAKVGLKDSYMGRNVSQLSGGNQQKVLFGLGFGRDYDIYIFDEPTVGVDMGTRSELYKLIKELAEAGKAVVIISSDLPEAINLAHRMVVFSQGRISAELQGDAIAEDTILQAFFDTEGKTA